MATCFDGDSFYLDASVTYDGLPTFDGCYIDSGYTAGDADSILYTRGGISYDYEPVVYATTNYGTATWVLAFNHAADETFYFRCKDADENDATLIHPTEVTQWNCLDGDLEYYTTLDAVTTSCGCPTPSPTAGPTSSEPTPVPFTPTLMPLTPAGTMAPSAPTPEPVAPVTTPTPQPTVLSTCGATESFRITSESFPEVGGCFQATSESFSNPGDTIEIWSVSGNTDFDQVVVAGLADDGTGETSDSPYSLAYLTEAEDDQIWYCMSNEDAITVHPVDATWQCDMSGTGSFVNVTDTDISFDCGCINTPSPGATEPPSSTPAPTATSASVPLWGVTLGAVGGAAFLIIVGIWVGRHRREKKRNGNSLDPPPGGNNLPVASQGGGGAGASTGGGNVPVSHPPPPASPRLPFAKATLATVADDECPPPPYSDPPAYRG